MSEQKLLNETLRLLGESNIADASITQIASKIGSTVYTINDETVAFDINTNDKDKVIKLIDANFKASNKFKSFDSTKRGNITAVLFRSY